MICIDKKNAIEWFAGEERFQRPSSGLTADGWCMFLLIIDLMIKKKNYQN